MVLAFAAYGAQALQKPFVDRTKEELVRTNPELADLEFDTNQDNLEGLLQAAGDNIEKLLAKFVDLSAAEDIHEMRFEDNMTGTSVRESFRYAVKVLQRGGAEQFDEFRVDPVTNIPVSPPAHSDFLVIGHFVKLLNYFAPQYRDQSRFRYLGRAKSDEGDCFVVAFAQHPEATELRSHIRTGPNGQTARLQGVAWIDAAAKRVVRLRLDLLEPVKGFPLETVTTDISWVPVSFPSIGSMLLLPAKVTVDARYAGGELHTVHRYSAYRAETDKTAGLAAVAAAGGEDSYELLTRGIALSKEGKSVDEIAILRDALRLNPAMAPARFYLANALRAAGDLPGAEAELREAVKVAPDSAVVHNLLGVVLSRRGDLPGAVAEFRTSTQLQPKEAIAHVNLAQALEKSGDRAAAIEEYRTASQLAPDNADFKARYEQLAHAPTSPATDTTIKVDVSASAGSGGCDRQGGAPRHGFDARRFSSIRRRRGAEDFRLQRRRCRADGPRGCHGRGLCRGARHHGNAEPRHHRRPSPCRPGERIWSASIQCTAPSETWYASAKRCRSCSGPSSRETRGTPYWQ